ncbi:MAG: DUF309 domain-containing protein [Candidatus Binatia bacterium]
MKLALRNRIAEWLLEAIGPERARTGVNALIGFARRADADGAAVGLPEEVARALDASGLFFTRGGETRLRADLAGELDALRGRTERFAAALAAVDSATLPEVPVDRVVAVAGLLFGERLFFEVHEILEPPWREAQGDDREILQGLIQVAVGFHHHEEDNLRGAISLLADGNAKLFAHLPEAYGVDLAALCRDVEAFAIALRHLAAGDPAVELPPLPLWRTFECRP